ncbi:MAG TPA: serine/threonine-protein kinase [Urbifossiella sp.]|jgi:serine/threonine-protein kinase|nr:serine/threonine-protein kinase [Urbifossiella sp.]
MSDDPRVRELLAEILESGSTPEEACRACPELLPRVRERWHEVCHARAELDVMFPPFQDPSGSARHEGLPLPKIAGYEVEAVIGQGGMGVAFRARHLGLNRVVALKMMLAGEYAGPQERERFRREAEAVAGLRHPNVVQVYDVGESDGHPFFTMEFVEGGSLARKLDGTPQPPHEAAALLATLAGAVHAAHQGGIVHRDLKPSNVLLTADGTPKISDFGLARRLGDEAAFTRPGAALGTPSYMAPEQADGKLSGVAVDVYALGAVLYELLTGRPPFRAGSAAATVLQVISEEPVAPSRLNAQVPRDLETICLKCLRKAPARRYASAQELAEDLHRFLEGKPVRARAVGVGERAVKWARRRPTAALLGATLLALAALGVWLRTEMTESRAAKTQREGQSRRLIEDALGRVNDLRRKEQWAESLRVLAAASTHVSEAGSSELEERLRRAQSDVRTADRIERVRESVPLEPGGLMDYRQRAREFREAFELAGLRVGDDAEEVAADIRASPVREQLVAGLDNWAHAALGVHDDVLVVKLLLIARSADPEPLWRDRFRHREVWSNADRLRELAGEALRISPAPPVHHLALLGQLLGGHRNTEFLAAACRHDPGSYWLNFEMGNALSSAGRSPEAVGYYRAALAARPESAAAYENLGMASLRVGRIEDSLAAYRRAVALAAPNRSSRTELVAALAAAGYWKDAAAECRRALEVDPTNPFPPFRLAQALYAQGRYEEAVVMSRTATEIDPNYVSMLELLGHISSRLGRHEEAVTAFGREAELLSLRDGVNARFLFNRELASVGRRQEAITGFRAEIALAPAAAGNYHQLGSLLRTQGQAAEADPILKRAVELAPWSDSGWAQLAAAYLDLGGFTGARAAAQRLLDLPAEEPERRAQRRLLEDCNELAGIEKSLPSILAGAEQPKGVATRLALAGWCLRRQRLPAAAVSLYTSAFSTQPSLAEDLDAGNRFHAARAAALAGTGCGEDVARLDDRQRAALRKQALDWLTAECDGWADRHRANKKRGERTVAARAVRVWLLNEDLVSVREANALAKLSPDERRDWCALWARVKALAANDPAAKIVRAREHVGRQEWPEAARCYAEAFELEPADDGELWYEYAAAQLLAGDRRGHQRTCAQMLARGPTMPQLRPFQIARACTLSADPAIDVARAAELSLGELQRSEKAFWSLTERGALHVRAGRVRDAVPLLEQSLAADDRPGSAVMNWLWLALAYHKLDKAEESRRWLAKAARWLDQQEGRMSLQSPSMGSHIHNWLEAQALRREVEALLGLQPTR